MIEQNHRKNNMHYIKSYKGLTEEEARAKAVIDTKEYLSEKQWEAVLQMVDDKNCTFQFFEMGLSLAGVEGHPVMGIWEFFGRQSPMKIIPNEED